MSTQTIFRIACNRNPFSQLSNAMLRDERLSNEELGVLVFILSHPPDWKFSLPWLARVRKIGRHKAQKFIRTYISAGYCVRQRARKEDGRLGAYEYIFSDLPGPQAGNGPVDHGPDSPALADSTPTKKVSQSKETRTQKPKAKPVEYVEGGGDRLIPFSPTDIGTVMADAQANAMRLALGKDFEGIDRLPFTVEVIRTVQRLNVCPRELILAYLEKTRGKRIKNPCAYLVKMAQDRVAKRNGMAVETVAALTNANRENRAAILAAEVDIGNPITTEQLRTKSSRVRTPNGPALLAALGNRGPH